MKADNEVYMVLLMRDESNPDAVRVKFTPAAYDMDKSPLDGGRTLAPSEVNFTEFVNEAMTDMDSLAANFVMEYAHLVRDNNGGPTVAVASDAQKADLYVKLLAAFGDRPMELIGNMLAGMIMGCVEQLVTHEDFDEMWDEYAATKA